MWYSGVACMIVIVIGCFISFVIRIVNKERKPVDPILLSPITEIAFACWPRSMRKWIRDHDLLSSKKQIQLEMKEKETFLSQDHQEKGDIE